MIFRFTAYFFFLTVVSRYAQASYNLMDSLAYTDVYTNEQLQDVDDDTEEETYKDYNRFIYPDTVTDSKPVHIHHQTWNTLTNDKAFDYSTPEIAPLQNNWLIKALYYLFYFFTQKGRWIIWVAVGTLIALVIYKILKQLRIGTRNIINYKSIPTQQEQYAIDYEQLIQDSINNHQITAAVAYMYQHIITLMQTNNVIHINKETTNAEILRFSRLLPYYTALKLIIAQFEYVCFGEYPISTTQFEKYYQTYHSLKKQIAP
jgi:hypothetical protein